jgi:transcriptional regulator with XRE-family HTH domain
LSDVAKNIRKYRAQRALTQDGLAEKLHVTRQTVSNWETGKNQPDLDMLEALSQALEVKVSALFGGKEEEEAYPRFQRRAVLWVAVLGFFTLLLLADGLFLAPYLLALQGRTFNILPRFLNSSLVMPLLCAAAGMLLPAVVSLWRMVRAVGRLRLVLLLAFAVLLLPVPLSVLWLAWPAGAKLVIFLSSDSTGFRFALALRACPFLAGLCLYPAIAPSERV